MGEAIDYNALSWVRQELAETLKQARHHLEEYAASKNSESLQGCAAHLHEARGPLKMVSLKGADLLTGEMEEIIADLLMGSVDQPDTALELLMQGFLELPEYLYSLRPGRPDNPAALFPLVNSLRANRGELPLEEEAVFSPDLSVRVPGTVFDVRAEHPKQDVAAMARAARIRFQTGLLDWYRNGDQGKGLQTLVEVLDDLTQKAGSEPVARLWWVSAGLAELLQGSAMQVTPAIKRLFGQIDRHIKRLMDQGEAVFDDVLTDDLLKNLLFHINTAESGSSRIAEIKSTYRLNDRSGGGTAGVAACSEELLQTVSGTVREDVVRVKEQLDEFLKGDQADVTVLTTVADELHALANMLGMIGMDRLAATVADREQLLRDCALNARSLSDEESAATANMLIAIEDALSDITATLDSDRSGAGQDDATFRQGQEAVVEAVMDDMSSAKESINEFLRSCGDFDLLVDVPVILNRIHGGLKLVGQERLATVTSMVKTFISRELVAGHRELSEEDLDTLADAICSVEYCVEELVANRDFGQRAINIAEESVEKLGYACPQAGETGAGNGEEVESSGMQTATEQPQPVSVAAAVDTPPAQKTVTDGDNSITSLQAIDPDGDPEIIEIFIEEAAEELEKITALIPAWCDDPVNADSLTEIRRSLHTMKGSGRMVGAMATGEFSWAMENLVNSVLDGSVDASERVIGLLRQVPDALAALLEQAKNPDVTVSTAINTLASEAHDSTRPGVGTPVSVAVPVEETLPADVDDTEPAGSAGEEESVGELPHIEQVPAPVATDFPVLSEDADAEIVDIFLEEAAGEFDAVSIAVPAWVTRPENHDLVVELQRSFHTLKGSGRMAGAMRIGEFCWIVELMFTRLTDGIIEQSAGLFTFMVRVPDTLKQMLDQIRDGSEPEIDIQEMINAATVLANGGQLSTVDEAGQAEEGIVDYDLHEAGEPPVADEEPALLEIFSKECGEHVQALHAWLGAYEEPGRVTDELYRSLHTLSGISESADMPAIGRLADGLYGWFGALYEEHLPVSAVGYEILRDSTVEIERILEALPEVVSDEDVLDMLCMRISVLPSMEQVAAAAAALPAEPSVDDVTEQPVEPPVSSEEDMALSPATPESSPQEWAGEGPAAELSEEQTDTEEAPESIEMLPADVTVSDEPLVETKTDGIVPEDEAVMQMAETAEELPPVEKVDISAAIEAPVEQEAGEAVIPVADASEQAPASQAGDPYAEIDQDLYEIFVEEATEVMDASETVLRSWSDEPDNRELMAEFQRHLHTLKGGARMVDLEAIGDLSHAVESVMTELADGKLQSSSELFGLLADAHDRLADMLDQVRNRQAITAAPDIEAVLHAVIEGGEVPTILPAAPVETITVAEVEPVTETESATAAEPVPEAEPVAEVEPVAEAEPVAEVEPVTEPEAASWPLVDDETIHEDEPVSVMPESAGSGEAAAGISTGDAGDGDEADSGQQEPAQPARRRASPPRLVIDRDQQSNARGDQVKVQSDVLDNMVNHAGEINIYRSRMEQQISDYRFNLSELDQTISRLRDQLRQLEMENEAQILYRYEQESELRNQEFDPLEMDRYSTLQQLSRSLIESISDLRSLQELMENTTRDSETLLLQQSRVSTELQENLIRTRMIPFVSLSPRLRRIARQSARQLDKKVEVELVGEDGEMDRAVVERIIAPLEHMLRNAVAHGIELPRVRKAAGKPVTGRISIEFDREGSEIVLQISDDGAGMDVEAIRERAIERGLMTDDSNLPDEDVIQFVLQTGFSTASEVTQISGRGVGMDVVNSEVKQLGGSLHIESEHGKGATLTVRLPYTLAINQGMLVTAGDETFCVPLASVEGVVRFYPEELRECYGDGQQLFEYGGNEYRLKHLGSLLETGSVSFPDERDQVPVLLVRAGEKRIGFHIEALQGIREVVIKPVGPQLSTVDGISGATILGDGRVVMILDMVAVSRREASAHTSTSSSRHDQGGDTLVVMVVDDSITVRKVTTRLLERNGYKVVTAKDGVDAMGKLQESIPDIMLLDIEMPRMDGFELATHMRNDNALKHLPIIMITSRTGDKHRERAREIGVQHYLGKPYQEADLLDSIHGIIGVSHVAAG